MSPVTHHHLSPVQDSGHLTLDEMRLPLRSLETVVSRVGTEEMVSKPWEWFTNQTFIPGPPLTPSFLLVDPSRHHQHPWHHPGTAPAALCGVNGGNPSGCPPGDTRPPGSRCWLEGIRGVCMGFGMVC